jgi:hypothetical protein
MIVSERTERRVRLLRIAATILAAVAALVVGAAHIRVVREVLPVHTRTVRVAVPAQMARDGEMTDDQCYALRKGTNRSALIDQYGLPKGGDPELENLGLRYPIQRAAARYCAVSFDIDDRIESASLDLPSSSWRIRTLDTSSDIA